MPLGNQHTQSPGREEESRGDKETPNLPEDAQGSPVPFENSTFNISGTSQLGLSFGKISADEDQNQSKSQSSLFDDEHDGMFEGLDLDIETFCQTIAPEEQPQVTEAMEATEKEEQVDKDPVEANATVPTNHNHNDDDDDVMTEVPVDKGDDISPTRKVQFKEDIAQVHLYDPAESPRSPKTTTDGSSEEFRAPIKPILKRRRRRRETSQPSRLQITPPENSMPSERRVNETLQRSPSYEAGITYNSGESSALEQEKYLLMSLLDLDCSVQMMKKRGDVLLARVQRAIQRLQKI